jgi:uncharacterized membrane protein YraQ (UPF0718 family)
MWISTITMGALALILVLVGYYRGEGQHIAGIKSGMALLVEILPLLIFAFVIAGMIQILLPQAFIQKWVGAESGFRGIIIGSVAGGFCPGGPFVTLPLAAGLLRAGAGIGTMVAFLTGWSLLALARLPLEVGVLGWKLTLIRFISTLIFPPLAGLIAQGFFSRFQ